MARAGRRRGVAQAPRIAREDYGSGTTAPNYGLMLRAWCRNLIRSVQKQGPLYPMRKHDALPGRWIGFAPETGGLSKGGIAAGVVPRLARLSTSTKKDEVEFPS
jgi:hypothetical protein